MLGDVVAERYASALFSLAVERGIEDEVEAQLELLKSLFEDRDFRKLLTSPRIRPEQKMQTLRNVLGGKLNPLLMRFLDLVINRKRAEHIANVADSFKKMLEQARGVARAVVHSAYPLDEGLESELCGVLQRITGKTILMEKHVDPSLLGGVMVRVGDRLLDGTLRTRLRELKEELLAAEVT